MNIKLFNEHFSDLVMFTLREVEGEGEVIPTEEELAAQQQQQQPQQLPQEDPYAQAPLEPEVDYTDGVNVASTDPMGGQAPIEMSIGRIYELKKIYSKLLAVSNLLDSHSDEKFRDLEKRVDESLDMFHIISLNLDKFESKIDKIIIEFYAFIQEALEEMETLSKKKEVNNKKDNK